ncbi:hypothetical protein [Psychrobacter sp. DAB_AL62B]|uniref:hypothetical protein n=1 Tax=Psychrobacter sp. DAB_AL62B TaxID=1028420 RepID=UPI0023819203|nr:hypothetical protein [Psychrobacter sp. DAB_AL62B]MDE4453765.1 hypothetical protein [Psychrobacter sp. DAB_AL62B]
MPSIHYFYNNLIVTSDEDTLYLNSTVNKKSVTPSQGHLASTIAASARQIQAAGGIGYLI